MSKGALGLLAAYWPEDTPRYAHVPLKLAAEITVHASATAAPERPALLSTAGALCYGDLSARVRQIAAALRGRLQRGARVAIALSRPGDLVATTLGATEAGMLAWASAAEPEAPALSAFSAELVIAEVGGDALRTTLVDLLSAPAGEAKPARPDFKSPVLVLPKPDGSGEVLHNQKTLAATAIAVAGFYMIDAETRVLLLEPPTDWLGLAVLLGCLHKGATVIAGWEAPPVEVPGHVDYLVCRWPYAARTLTGDDRPYPRLRVGAGAIVGMEEPFSLSRRRRISRRLRTPVLTLFGRSDLGPVLGSHPTWFLDDAVGIPLPNVDTRPLDPATGAPLNIGWDAVEEAELGVKSALAPAGGDVMEGWLRTRRVAAIDPTGLYFFRSARAAFGGGA